MITDEMKVLLKEYVEELINEAVKRDRYVEDALNALKGAFGEYLKARYAEANPARKGVLGTMEGWDKEATKLLQFNLRNAVTRRMKGGGQGGAFAEALEDLKVMVPAYLKWARGEVATAFGLDERTMQDPPDSVTDEFFARAKNEFDSHFE